MVNHGDTSMRMTFTEKRNLGRKKNEIKEKENSEKSLV